MFLEAKGIRIRIVNQGGGYLVPDAEFDLGGQSYNVEVECSTLVKHVDQVARNVRKATVAGRRCLVVVSGQAMAVRFASVFHDWNVGSQLWRDVGLIARDAKGVIVPVAEGATQPWGWLIGRPDEMPSRSCAQGPEIMPEKPGFASLSDLARALRLANRLVAAGNLEATARDFLRIADRDDAVAADARRLGMALRSLGVRQTRVWRDGRQTRIYDLHAMSKP
ncbi:MAG: hypothetical protein L3K00_00460 [Thermoplasmata archaeon]|nr:hypothetical protein [Thermoplasmata archaeon]